MQQNSDIETSPVAIIIPVYNGYEPLTRLTATLFANTDRMHDIIFIDDASTDPRIAKLLSDVARDNPNVRVVHNETNRGFPHNANLGASLSDRDFVLLNSDTEVPPNWIPRLFRPIWHATNTASATPFASWSKSHGFMEDPAIGRALCERHGIEAIDKVLATLPADPEENAIIRGHGFCLAISRKAWNAVGPFNEELFEHGYGEETDWCLRAHEAGFVNRLVPNLLVGHWHGGSFTPAETTRLIRKHRDILKRLHPNAPKTKCRDLPAFILARSRIREELAKAGIPIPKIREKGQKKKIEAPSEGEPTTMKKKLKRLIRFIAGLRPCLKRDLVQANKKVERLHERLQETRERQKETVRRLKEEIREEIRDHSEKIDRLSASLKKANKRIADNRYLANLALPRAALRESVIRWWYIKNPEIPLNLDKPRTFCEKIQCLKLTADTPLLTRLADKYAVREWVADKIGAQHLTPLLGVWERAEDVDLAALPQRFVLKANHGSHMIRIVKDKDTLNIDQLRAEMSIWLATNYAFVMSPQLQYANIPRKIIAEEYVENADGELHDWKVWCYRGRAHYIEFMSRKDVRLRFVFLDRDWKPTPFRYNLPGMEPLDPPPRPDNLDELLRLAETLAAGFEFVRVDFYRLDDGSYRFGEMTFSPSGGNAQFDPPEYNAKIGALFDYTPDNRMPGAPAE